MKDPACQLSQNAAEPEEPDMSRLSSPCGGFLQHISRTKGLHPVPAREYQDFDKDHPEVGLVLDPINQQRPRQALLNRP